MPVKNGTRFGPYEILSPIGAGGMGEVYRARDTRLERTVAIKILSERVSSRPEGRERFEREARTVAGLSHPHICALHDVGEQDGIVFLVMEHLEGETLARRLDRGALPLEEVLRHAAEIAEALAEAHRHGVVHRDVKPGNVMLTHAGAKLLDFGLAKLRPEGLAGACEDRTLTAENALVGTLPYMAPEQLEGGRADARTDIFALGALIYEMTTGVRAFAGSNQASLIASILRGDVPPLASSQPMAPRGLDRLVRHCLRKDPAERWQSAHDLALRLRDMAAEDPGAETESRGLRGWRWRRPALGAALLLAALAGVVVGRPWRTTPGRATGTAIVRSSVDLPSGTLLTNGGFTRTELALSPDGRLLVWSASPDDSPASPALYRRPLDRDEARAIAGTEGGSQPFFSPDGRWIGFYDSSRGKLRKIPVEGGLALDLAEIVRPGPMGAAWTADGRILLGNQERGLDWIPDEGGFPRALTAIDGARETGHRLPWLLPGGKAVLVTAVPHAWGVRARVEAFALAGGGRRLVVEDAADARFLATGHLVFVRQGTLMAAPFDPDRLELQAPPVPVLDDVRQALNMGYSYDNSGAAQFAVSSAGLLVHATGGIFADRPAGLVLVDLAGRAEPLAGFDRPLTTPQVRFSPDGRQVAFTERARSGLAWAFDVERQTERPLSRDGIAGSPIWSPAGDRLALGWSAAGPLNLWLVPAEGGVGWERLTEGQDWPSCWTPDGRALLFVRSQVGHDDIFMYRFEDRQVVPLLTTRANERIPEISPDGRWLAYVSDESGRDQVLVTSFPDRRLTAVVSRDSADSPAWSRDGRTLFYVSGDPVDRQLLSVSFFGGDLRTMGRPVARFRLPPGVRLVIPVRGYDVHPDGRRFLFAQAKDGPAPPTSVKRLHLVQNWFAELERLSPAAR